MTKEKKRKAINNFSYSIRHFSSTSEQGNIKGRGYSSLSSLQLHSSYKPSFTSTLSARSHHLQRQQWRTLVRHTPACPSSANRGKVWTQRLATCPKDVLHLFKLKSMDSQTFIRRCCFGSVGRITHWSPLPKRRQGLIVKRSVDGHWLMSRAFPKDC